MKTTIALALGVATFAFTPLIATAAGGHGTDITHFAFREAMTDNGVEPGSAGTVAVSEAIQGNADKEKLDVTASGLTADTDYDIVANVNGQGAVDLGTFTTDGKGKLTAHFSNSAKGKTTALPDGVDVSQIIGLDIDNGGVAVLSLDATAPASLKYQVKRNLNNGGSANGTLQISSSKGKTKFSLTATGLDADTDYSLVFNGGVVETVTSDSKGRLKLTDAPLPDNVLDLQTVEIQDASSTAVLATSTPLP